jgi:hypothetical protein
MTNKEYYDLLFQLEDKYKLYDIKFKDKFSVWSGYRNYFEAYDLRFKGVYSDSVEIIHFNINYLKKYLKLLLKGNIFKLFSKRSKYIILEHPRSNKDGEDIYTYDIKQHLDNYVSLSFSVGFSGLRKKTIYLDTYKIFAKIFAKLFKNFLSNSRFEKYQMFLNELNSHQSLFTSFKEYYLEFIFMYYFYRLVFMFHKPLAIFSVVYYENIAFIAAAKSLNIPTVELQHGVIYPYHFGYSYPYSSKNFIGCNPDYICLLSKYWEANINYHEASTLITLGNSFLVKKATQYEKLEKTIIIVSQGIIGHYLVDFLDKNIKDLADYTVYFKLHPSDRTTWKEKYPLLDQLNSKYENLQVVSNEIVLDELQAICRFQIGVFSTAVYEGLENDCYTFLLNINGIEAMENLIKMNKVILIENDDNLVRFLEKGFDKYKLSKVEFFSKFDHVRFRDLIKIDKKSENA